ncbi:MAG: nucleotidyltransferase domain-containing protein [Balneolaceae bacterium]|nr:nucleotidyltransferase domain-containing protein [Balneolaceae bacterium]MCH8547738.1 nucleotidyltransferase domain-containing protein [Balneolaceae bacterium]
MNITQLKTAKLEQACEDFRVKRLYVFGSAASGHLSDESDLDFLVEFDRQGYQGAFEQYMGFKQRLETIYQRPVDLVTVKKFRNPLFQKEIDSSKTLIYAA